MIIDPLLPGAEQLLGSDVHAVLRPAVEAAGGRLLDAQPTQVRYDPGRRMTVRYAARIAWAEGQERTETMGALVQPGPLPADLAVVHDQQGARVGVWRYPHDPFLPGLPHAAYPEGARQVLAHLGVDVPAVTVEPIVYRPGSRAVLRIRAHGLTAYAKIVRPGAVSGLRDLHERFVPDVPVPRILGWSEPLGVVVLEPLVGAVLTRRLVAGGALPRPSALVELLGRIRAVPLAAGAEPARPAVGGYASLLQHALPDAAERVAEMARQAADLAVWADQTIHGDLYPGQIIVGTDGRPTGLLDIDGARRGGSHDDPATLIGHLVALAHVHPRAARRIDGFRCALQDLLGEGVDQVDLHRAVLGVLLGLATTSFRRQEPDWQQRSLAWLGLCEQWAAAAPGR